MRRRPALSSLQCYEGSMKIVLPLFTIAYGAVAGLFGIAGLVLMGFAFLELWTAVIEPEGQTLPAWGGSCD